jgi:citrate lyase subunit beta/citryl-CoA lyase
MAVRRTLLFIPGNNPAMMLNAPVLGADTVVFDIEDAVSIGDKDAARILIRNTIQTLDFGRVEVAVRINDITTPYWQDDLRTVVPAKPSFFVLPKIELPEHVLEIDNFVGKLEKENNIPVGTIKFGTILETALGIENALAIGRTCKERLTGLLVGGEDLAASLWAVRTRKSHELLYARQRVITAARALGLTPYDTVYPDVEDIEGLIDDTKFSREIGFPGRGVISPRHVDIVNELFSPAPEEVQYAKEVMDIIEEAKRLGKGAIMLYGKMIDAPVVARARQVLEIAEQIGGGV